MKDQTERHETQRLQALLDTDAQTDPRSWSLAGWHLEHAPIIGTTTVDNRDGGHAGTFDRPTHSAIPSAEQWYDAVDVAQRAAGDLWQAWDDDERRNAVRTVQALRANPADARARAAALSVPVDPFDDDSAPGTNAPAPDAFTARDHEVKVGRNRKGAQTLERIRVGAASVIGGSARVFPNDLDASTEPTLCDAIRQMQAEIDAPAVMADGRTVAGVRRDAAGRGNAFDIQRMTDHYLRCHDLPALEGSDVTAWHEVRDVPKGRDPRDVPGAVHRAGISGRYQVAAWDAFASPEAVHAPSTAKRPTFPNRVTLKRGRARSGDQRDVRRFVVDAAGVAVSAWELVAPANDTDHRYVGHRLVARPTGQNAHGSTRKARADASKQAKVKRQARSIGTVTEPANLNGWRELLANIGRGESLTVTTTDGNVTVTREEKRAGRYATSGARGRHRARTVESIALRIGQ